MFEIFASTLYLSYLRNAGKSPQGHPEGLHQEGPASSSTGDGGQPMQPMSILKCFQHFVSFCLCVFWRRYFFSLLFV